MKNHFLFSTLITVTTFFTQTLLANPLWECSPEQVRGAINDYVMSIDAPISEVEAVEEIVIPSQGKSIPIRIYKPSNRADLPVILFIHGGGWIAGNLDTHDLLARYLCSQTKAIVAAVGYSNAPEVKFPSSLEECYDALVWVKDHGKEFSANPSKFAIVGDSAGANMGAALSLMVRDRGGPNIDLQVLINPSVDLTCGGTLEKQNDAFDSLRWMVIHYLPSQQETIHPYASPLFATDLSHLPKTVLLISEKDMLRQQEEEYAEKLINAGVATEVHYVSGQDHLAGEGARATTKVRPGLDKVVEALISSFYHDGSF